MIRILFILTITVISTTTVAQEQALPPEVSDYLHERNLCEHFRGEPHEGNSPEQIERRKFIFESLEIYCAGTDRRLKALKSRYKANAMAIESLGVYEEQAEGVNNDPNK